MSDDRYDHVTRETWLPIPGLVGAYEVSDLGRVRSVTRIVTAGTGARSIPARVLTCVKGAGPYLQVTLRRKTRTVHSLVALTFLGPRPDGYEACHGNGDPHDNRLANLRYDTVSENRKDTLRHGRNVAANRTHCPQGHPYDEANTGRHRGARRCLACHREHERARRRAKKETAA